MKVLRSALVLTILIITFINCDEIPPVQIELLPFKCIQCICDASTGCNPNFGCHDDVCGPFKMTWGYWYDAGSPCVKGDTLDSPNAYQNCANNPDCAIRAIRGYMNKYHRDCNGDGLIDCYDFAAIHELGASGCQRELPTFFKPKLIKCLQ